MRWLLALVPLVTLTFAADPPPKITPGKVVVPTDKMRRIWGELVSIEPKTRTGTFRNESDDVVMPFTVTPYAELLHHAARGDLQDFKVGERAIFRLHEDADGKWVYLTYIQDEMTFQAGHKEYYWVNEIDPKAGAITFTQANADKTYTRDKGLVLETDANTKYWKKGKPAAFADIKVGDKLLAKTHGTGKGKHRVCWEVYLDDESRDAVRDEQRAVHSKRMATGRAAGVRGRGQRHHAQVDAVLRGRGSGEGAEGRSEGEGLACGRGPQADRRPGGRHRDDGHRGQRKPVRGRRHGGRRRVQAGRPGAAVGREAGVTAHIKRRRPWTHNR